MRVVRRLARAAKGLRQDGHAEYGTLCASRGEKLLEWLTADNLDLNFGLKAVYDTLRHVLDHILNRSWPVGQCRRRIRQWESLRWRKNVVGR